MTACPELALLERGELAPPVATHVAGCEACRLVVGVFAHAPGEDGVSEAACLRFDALLAARADGSLNAAGKSLLARHLASCLACREVADTLSPLADLEGDLATLPSVDPAGYALGLEIARGGMGRVIAARDLRIGRPIAVKELLGRSPDLAARFEREARVTARLQHPGIVPIYEIGRWPDGTPFYSMRMVDGRTLLDAITAAPTLPERLALLPSVIAASEAVAFAHAQRVIHRDLTPSNVLVGAYGETVVIDWGLAKDLATDELDAAGVAAPAASDHLTGEGMVIGTAAYMPPEQAHAVPVDERADVYALGAILYHLLAGVAPYHAPTTRALLRQLRTGPPAAIATVCPGAPRDLVSVVTKAMSRDPADRYPSARELAEELRRFQTGRLVEAHRYSQLDRLARVLRRHRGAATVALLAIVLLAAVGAASVSRVLQASREARQTVRELLVEEGRVELLAGNPLRSLAYLHEAYRQGTSSPALGFLIDAALDGLPSSERLLDCGGDVRYVEFSPDGRRVVAACHDVARLWNLEDGAVIATLGPAPAAFDGVAYTHDGTRVVTWGEAGVARLWDGATGEARGVFDHGAPVTTATFTPDDRRLATTGKDGTAQIWDTASARRLRTIVGATGWLRHLYGAISGDGTRLFTLTMDGEGKGWELDTGALLGGFHHGGGALLLGAELSRDGTRAVTCGTDRLAKVWDTRTSANVVTVAGHTDVVWKCVFSPDGTRLLTTSHDGKAIVWDLATGAAITSVDHGEIVLWGRFSPDGRRILTVGVDGLIKIWDPRSGALLASHDSVGGKDAHFSPDGSRLIAQRGDGRIQIWREARYAVDAFTPPPATRVIAVSSDGARTAIEHADGAVTLHDTLTGAALPHVPLHAPLAMSRDARTLAATAGGTIVILDLATGTRRQTLASAAAPSALELTEDGRRLVITRGGRAPELWDVERARLLATLPAATHATPSRTGEQLLAWAEGHAPFVWDVPSRSILAALVGASRFRPLGFSADGSRLALLEYAPDGSRWLTLWDASRTAPPLLRTLDAGVEPAWNPGGTLLTTISADHLVTVWRATDGRERSSFVHDQLLSVQASTDGSLIAGIGDHGTTVVVLSADGRVLARTPIAHPAPQVSQTGFQPPSARAWWSPAGDAIISQAISVVVRPARTEIDARRLASLVATTVPWKVVRGRLVWIDKVALRGAVRHAGRPVAGATIALELRHPAQRGADPVDYDTMTMTVEHARAITDEEGGFELPALVPPGRYTITATAQGVTRTLEADVGIESDFVTVELAP